MINVRQGVFHLRNEEASYLFRVKDGFLEHLHFGARAETADALAFAARPGCGWGDSTLYREGSNADCLDILPLEWSGCGRGDYRESPLELSIGGRAVSTDFRYLGCEVLKEPPPSALPVSRGQTILAVYLEDAAAKLRLTLLYGVLPTVFTRRAILENCGSSAVHIRKCMSACTELPGDWELHTFSGGWIAEMQHTRTPVTLARTCLESTTGASSSRANPGFLLAAPDAGEQAGAVYGFNLLYSGSHYLSAQKSLQGLTRVLQGISPANFDWELAPGARFETPEAVMAYSGAGFGGLSACFHRYVNEHLIPPDWQGRPRPIVYNSWEGCMFDFTESKLLRLGRAAKQLGCELFVLDDGWFGNKYPRNNSNAGLGDWQVNAAKLPEGIDHIASYAHSKGLKFGIWIEPEMVSPKSELAEKHPDWIVRPPKREAPTTRNQWLLDLTNPKVQDFVFGVFDNTMKLSDKIDYIKWDANRNANNVGSAYLPADEQSRFWIDYAQGFYKVMERIRAKYPDVLIQACASGGGRVEYGALKYFDEVWTSDNTEALSRARIQYGTSLFYPAVVMGSHVSATPNHQTGNITPIKFRFDMACAGRLGMELQPRQMTDEERQFARRAIASYKEYRDIVMQGDLYRIGTPYDKSGCYGLMYVSKDRKQAVLFTYSLRYQGRSLIPKFRLQGLDPKTGYTIRELNVDKSRNWFDGKTFSGEMLSNAGINPSMPKIYDSGVFLLTAE